MTTDEGNKIAFAVPAGYISGSIQPSPGDPNFRWRGQDTTGDKSPEAAARARKNQFATIEEFEIWRRSKGFPDLNHWNLVWAWANFKGEPTTERAVANPILERR
jgi:hypothetical protein